MSAKVYVLLDITDGQAEQVADVLRGKDGVRDVDLLDSNRSLMLIVEALERQRLAELTIKALTSVENMTEGLQLLPVREGNGYS